MCRITASTPEPLYRGWLYIAIQWWNSASLLGSNFFVFVYFSSLLFFMSFCKRVFFYYCFIVAFLLHIFIAKSFFLSQLDIRALDCNIVQVASYVQQGKS